MSLRREVENRVRAKVHRWMSRTLAHTSITPNTLTLIGALLTLGASMLIAHGDLRWAGVAVLFASLFDMLDGGLARAKQQMSQFGAFLDSTLDRYSDALLMLGLFIYYQRTAPQSTELLLAFVAAIGSLLTSYVRARAEALNFTCNVGMVERPERIVLIVIGLLTGWVGPMLWLLAILTNLTALQRVWHVWNSTRIGQSKPKRQPGLAQPGE